MLERVSSMDSRIMPRRLGAAVLSGSLIFAASACANDRPPCNRSYEIGDETTMVNDKLVTPDGKVDVSFNTKGGDVVHMYFEKGPVYKDLTDDELARRQAEFALQRTVIRVEFDDNEISFSCQPKSKTA